MVLVACTNTGALLPPSRTATALTAVAVQTPSSTLTQLASSPTSVDCGGDTEPAVTARGWRLVWQRSFEHPVGIPPVVDGEQMLLVERIDPHPDTLNDVVLAIDPQTGKTQWQIADTEDSVPYKARKTLEIDYSQKYWLLLIQYVRPQLLDIPNPIHLEIVVDRLSGQVVYSGTLSSYPIGTTAISDEAIIDNYEEAYMRRIDLPSGAIRWMNPWSVRGTTGLVTVGDWLYAFDYDGNVHRYNLSDGKLAGTTILGVIPRSNNDILVHDESAVVRSEKYVARFDFRTFSPIWATEVSYAVGGRSNAFWDNQPSMTLSANSTSRSAGKIRRPRRWRGSRRTARAFVPSTPCTSRWWREAPHRP